MIGGNPALRHLARLKFRGAIRRQTRKLKTLSGAFFAGVGVLITCAWVASLVFGRGRGGGGPVDPEVLRPWVQLGIAVFGFMSILSAASIRGIYLPKQDIERLFAGPVKRTDLVRYRMLVDLGRSLFGALVLGLLTFHRMPRASFGLLGAMLTILTLGIVRQAFSLLLGGGGRRVRKFLKSRSLTFVRVLFGVGIWLLIVLGVMGSGALESLFGDLRLSQEGGVLLTLEPVMSFLSPTLPWANMMTATDFPEFAKWFGICLALGLLMFEFTARLPVDFREMSLETSEQISTRLKQIRRGGLFNGGKVSTRTASWRLPRIFGKGPMGAVAWIKLVSIVRKARGTLLMGVVIVVFVAVVVTFIVGPGARDEKSTILGSGLIGLFGITYLGGALRFDFRSDLDRMVQIKAWPVSPMQVFIATLLPEVFLISGLLGAAILIRMAVLGIFHPVGAAIPLVLPFFAFAWLSVDNVVYLFAPVRFVPGQEGSLHHTGRAIVLFLVRIFLILVVAALVGSVAMILFSVGPDVLGLSALQATWISAMVGFGVLLAVNVFLAWAGGRMLKRFDVARDRG